MTIFNVNSSSELMSASKVAKDGDTILLATGTYSNVRIHDVHFTKGVTISSADPSKPAIFTDFLLQNSSGVTLSFVSLNASADTRQLFSFNSSSNIHLDNLDVHGTGMPSGTAVPGALFVRDSNQVTVTNSNFHDMQAGLSLLDSNSVSVSNNYFHDIQIDGIHGGGNSNLSISNNVFTDFHPTATDHSDAIQLWTTNTTASAHDISITDNLITRGTGAPIQGIFLRDQVGNLPFVDVHILGNLVLGETYRGISVSSSSRLTIENNQVIGFADQESRITTDTGSNTVISDNVATKLSVLGLGADQVNNTTVKSAVDGGAAALNGWLQLHHTLLGPWGTIAQLAGIQGLQHDTLSASDVLAPVSVDVTGTSGDDRLTTKVGFDSNLFGGDGNDSLIGSADTHNLLMGGNGDDVYSVKGMGDVVVELDNGGIDRVHTWIDYTLPINVENLRLVVGGLVGSGNEGANVIWGSTGDDHIFGMGGNDTISGDDGQDQLWGGDGDDNIRGDGGNDLIHGDAGNDTLYGGDGADTIYGGTGDDTIDGGDDNDVIFGEVGNDTIKGGDGDDRIDGGAGNDIIIGGKGADWMTGGDGSDTFRYLAGDLDLKSTDTITDFSRGDKIDLRAIDANVLSAKDDAFTFIGTSAFHHIAGELRYSVSGDNIVISGDVNGDGVADFMINLLHVHSIQATDFVL